MKCNRPRKMTPKKFREWFKTTESEKASLKGRKRKELYDRTLRILEEKNYTKNEFNKWKSFPARHMKGQLGYCKNPTSRRRFAIKNWGYDLAKSKYEKNNI